MIRSLRLVTLPIALALTGTACWMEVPNLQSTGGGYPPELSATSAGEPDHDARTAAETGSETAAEAPAPETHPGGEQDST